MEKINNPRTEIDRIDTELLRLLNERARVALRVGAAKSDRDDALCDPTREHAVLARVRTENPGPFDEHGIENIFQRIIDESLYLQQKHFNKPAIEEPAASQGIGVVAVGSRVAFLGARGTFSEEAASAILNDGCQLVSFPTFESLFRAIEEEKADYILTPLENSLVGSVHRCYDLLLRSSLSIVAELVLPVSHFLVAPENATLETIRTVESHPAALAQCERFFAAYPHLRAVAAGDTAGSVQRAVESGDDTRAAIGSKRAAAIYGGKILREHLEDHAENFTRFALLSNEKTDADTADKISLVVRLKHKPGALHSALRPFVRRGLDLLKIESRPIKDSPKEFNFYIDLRPPVNDGELAGALKEIDEHTEDVRFLGRYSTINLKSDQN
ncbi:MAG: prephenate dehydratase [Acidobacteria bacterium]|nr:prephenate dehydratase [Acidobacteriota bacterium]